MVYDMPHFSPYLLDYLLCHNCQKIKSDQALQSRFFHFSQLTKDMVKNNFPEFR